MKSLMKQLKAKVNLIAQSEAEDLFAIMIWTFLLPASATVLMAFLIAYAIHMVF